MEVEGSPVAEIRHRNKAPLSETRDTEQIERPRGNRKVGQSARCVAVQQFVKLFVGCLVTVTSGMMYAVYLSTYHERKFWFSSRRDLEREITFQGDGAVYYSFYKDMLRAPSFERGVFELAYNNRTVPMKTINAVQQMTLYPELIASALYQMSGSQGVVDPVYFYIGIIFGLQGIYISALFVTSWIMSGTWLAGLLTAAWFIINRTDTTRMDDSIPLRENWALPYFACQVAALTGFLRNNNNLSAERFCYLLMSASTYTFIMMWEYSHYLLFIQALSLCLLDGLSLVKKEKVHDVHKMYLFSVFLGYLLQFENLALLTSPLLCLVVGSMIAKSLQISVKRGTFRAKLMKIMYFYLAFTIAASLHFLIRTVIPHKENRQILKFLEVKFGLNMTKNFTVNWLLCQESFQPPSQDYILRLTQSSLLPFYILVFFICLFSVCQGIVKRLQGVPISSSIAPEEGRIGEKPEVIYHVIQTLLLGSLAMTFEGMKYLWTPYVCVLAAFGVCSPELWITLFKWIRLKSVHPVLLETFSTYKQEVNKPEPRAKRVFLQLLLDRRFFHTPETYSLRLSQDVAFILSAAVPAVIGFSLWREFLPQIVSELTELEEHYESDAVELMNWIKGQAPIAAVFAGSPQLMAAIKLCTGWMVTSLPVYNDEDLMKRNEHVNTSAPVFENLWNRLAHTGVRFLIWISCRPKDSKDQEGKKVYQIYSMRSAEDIYKILTSYKANYVVIEDAICNDVAGMKGCRVKDLLDVANDHLVNENGDIYAYSKYGRFCHEIKMNYSPYVNYFTRVFWNRSYFVYKINTLISFQY